MLHRLTERFGRGRASRIAVLTVTAVILISILLCSLFSLIPSSVRLPDITANSMYTLSEKTLTALKSLSAKTELYLIAYDENVNSSIQIFMERYTCENKNITFKLLDPEDDADVIGNYVSSPTSNSILVICGEKYRYIDYYDLFSFTSETYMLAYYEYYMACQQNSSLSSIDLKTYAVEMGLYDEFVYEAQITAAIKYVTAENTKKICVLSGHGEGNVTYDLINRAGIDCMGFHVLDAETDPIPSETECVFIICTTDISDTESEKLSEFMDNGGRLIALTGFGYDVPNFYKLAEKYGLTSENKLVCDDSTGANYGGTTYAVIPKSLSDDVSGVLSDNGASLVLSSCAPINISKELPSGITVTPLISTSENAYLKSTTAASTSTEFNDSTDTRETRHVGVRAENEKGGGITWLSSFSYLLDSYDVLSAFGNKLVLTELFNISTENTMRNDVSPIMRSSDVLEVPTAFEIVFIALFCAVLPIAVITVCIVRRKRIYSKK